MPRRCGSAAHSSCPPSRLTVNQSLSASRPPGHYSGEGGESHMLTQLKQFATSLRMRLQLASEEGQAMIEYALIVSLVSIAAVAALTPLGEAIKGIFEEV